VIDDVRAGGASSLQQISEELNARGIPTPRGVPLVVHAGAEGLSSILYRPLRALAVCDDGDDGKVAGLNLWPVQRSRGVFRHSTKSDLSAKAPLLFANRVAFRFTMGARPPRMRICHPC
jgi:hypothetical protein